MNNKMVVGTIDTEEEDTGIVSMQFSVQEICEFVNNPTLNDEQLKEIADILAANVECPEDHRGLHVEIDRDNFCDGYGDMEEDLRERYYR